DWRDEGLLAYGAVRVMHGEVPQRDFVSVQPPLSFYTAAGIFKLCGTSLVSLRGFGLSIFFLLPLLTYGVGRNFMDPVLSFAAATPACILGLPYCNFVPLAIWQGIAASLAAVFFFLLAALSTRQWLAFPAGALSALPLFLPPFVQAIALLYLARSVISRRFGRREALLTFLVIWSALFYLQVIIRSDFTHLAITLSPFFLLTAFGWSIVHEKIANYRKLKL